jgi:hypothetical protein
VGGPNLGVAGVPITWDPAAMPIHYRVDPGPMAVSSSGTVVISNSAAITRVNSMFNTWASVPTAALSFANDGPLLASGAYTGGPVASGNSLANFNALAQSCNNGEQSPVIFDPNGNLFSQLGIDSSVIGFASPCDVDPSSGHIVTAGLAMNGEFQDGVDSGNNYELTAAEFNQAITHEIGHFLGLDHSQINVEVLDQQPLNCNLDDAAGLPIMFPVLFCEARTTLGLPPLAPDDMAWISELYPVTTATSGKTLTSSAYGTIQGTVYFSDGATEAQGVNVIAREVDNPATPENESLRVAFSNVSGDLFTGNPGQSVTCTTPGTAECNTGGSPLGSRDPRVAGTFTIPVTPGTYTVSVESINSNFNGGSSVGPLNDPIPMPGTAPAAQQVTAMAGGSVTVNITLVGTATRFDEFESALMVGDAPTWNLGRRGWLKLWERRDDPPEQAAR